MKKITTYLLLIFVLITMLFAGCSSQPSAGGDAAESDTIKIGWIGSLTGDQAVWGTCEFDTLKMVVEDANAAGGLLGKQIEVIGYDTRGDATEAVNAVTRSRLAVEAQIGSLNVESVLALQTTVNALQTKVNSDSQKITNILAGSSIDYDTFAEIVALITTKDAETAADLDVIRTTLEALIATKMSKVQTSNTALEYVDANDASKKYKIVIVDGQLAVEDITPAG